MRRGVPGDYPRTPSEARGLITRTPPFLGCALSPESQNQGQVKTSSLADGLQPTSLGWRIALYADDRRPGRGGSGLCAPGHSRFWPCGAQGQLRFGLVRHKASCVLALGRTRTNLVALWHTRPNGFWPWGPQGHNGSVLGGGPINIARPCLPLGDTSNVRNVVVAEAVIAAGPTAGGVNAMPAAGRPAPWHQRLPARPGGPMGWRQGERPRARTRPRCDRRLPEPQNGLRRGRRGRLSRWGREAQFEL